MATKFGSLPFPEAIETLRGKLNLPTQTWTDLWEGQHARAFTVAGATREELLSDLRGAVTAALEDGETLEQFRSRFDKIVSQHGWSFRGGRNWRTRVIYETNMRTAYQAGRFQQLQAVKARRPFWLYKHSDLVTHPRPLHVAWDGLVLSADDPWWDTHYPPNGWGCRCTVRALSERDLARRGKDGPDQAPPIEWEDKTVGVRGPNPRSVRVPQGIDPGWAYNVGKARFGQRFLPEEWADWQETIAGRSPWRSLLSAGPAERARPATLPLFPAPAPLAAPVASAQEVTEAIRQHLGGERKFYDAAGYRVEVDAEYLGQHVQGDRATFFPLLDDLLNDPYETWVNWIEHEKTGEVRLSVVMLKAYDVGRRGRGSALQVIAQAHKGRLRAYTVIPVTRDGARNKNRRGVLLQGKEEGE